MNGHSHPQAGMPLADPATLCHGDCDGTGVVPVYVGEGDRHHGGQGGPGDDVELIIRWRAAEQRQPSGDGWHFVACPACEGSGRARRWRIRFVWYDFWVGAFWDRRARVLYVCPLPTIVIEIHL